MTGATSGIGLATATALMAAGWRVIIHGRSEEKCRAAIAAARAAAVRTAGVQETEPDIAVCDLGSLTEVRDLAGDIAQRFDSLDVLINNAGVFTARRRETADGFEMQFGVNHLAPFVLTQLLLPLLAKSPSGRVIAVSSGSHRSGRIHWKNLQLSGLYSGLAAYGQSKLANVLFAFELQRRLSANSRIESYALEPGLVNTEMGEKGTPGLISFVWSRRKRHGVTPEEGGATSVKLATDPEVAGEGGSYWAACRQCQSSRRSLSESDAARLWRVSAELCGMPDNPVLNTEADL